MTSSEEDKEGNEPAEGKIQEGLNYIWTIEVKRVGSTPRWPKFKSHLRLDMMHEGKSGKSDHQTLKPCFARDHVKRMKRSATPGRKYPSGFSGTSRSISRIHKEVPKTQQLRTIH